MQRAKGNSNCSIKEFCALKLKNPRRLGTDNQSRVFHLVVSEIRVANNLYSLCIGIKSHFGHILGQTLGI